MSKLNWYWNRLQLMSVAEIIYRIKTTIFARFQLYGIGTADNVPKYHLGNGAIAIVSNKSVPDSNIYEDAAKNITEGNYKIFSLDDANVGRSPQWNRDPSSGVTAPLLFGKTLDYRSYKLCGDIKFLWEPNRHLQLVTLAQAYKLSQKEKYLNAISLQLSSWFKQCPYNKGPNWTSSLELGIRLINWSIVWGLIGGKDSPIFKEEGGKKLLDDWMKSVYQHCHFIKNHFSRFSSANNHLIGEAAGLFIGTTTWPYWNEFKTWQNFAFKELMEEALKQNYSDGVNKEQAVSYQQFVLDFLLLAGLVGKKNDIDFPSNYWAVIEKMLEYLASIMDVSGNVPMIGDADDGYVTNLSQEKYFCPYKSLLATGAILFTRPEFKVKAKKLDDKTRWLMGEEAEFLFNEIATSNAVLPIKHQFSEGGYYILGSDFESEEEIKIVVDAGPLGYTNIAAHGHADALAFTLSIGGNEFLIDPGTYSYHTQKKWRDYFRGTSAHNTLRVDKLDQSVSGGNFMWLKKADSKCEKWSSGVERDHFVGSHNGYMRLSDPVLHRREIKLEKKDRKVIISDLLICKEKHHIEQFWHFSEQCVVEQSGAEIIAKNVDKLIKLRVSNENFQIRSIRGSEDLPSGWVSRSFDVKLPTKTVIVTTEIEVNGVATLITEIAY